MTLTKKDVPDYAQRTALDDRLTDLKNRHKKGAINHDTVMAGLQHLIEGKVVVPVQQIQPTSLLTLVNLDADPFIPKGWTVESHTKGGQWTWDPKEITLYLSKHQQGGKVIEGNKLRKELEALKDTKVFNANLLDYLLKNTHLIPNEWKVKTVCFWGTIYRHSHGCLYVRYLYWYGKSWNSSDYWLDRDFRDDNPALVSAASPEPVR